MQSGKHFCATPEPCLPLERAPLLHPRPTHVVHVCVHVCLCVPVGMVMITQLSSFRKRQCTALQS